MKRNEEITLSVAVAGTVCVGIVGIIAYPYISMFFGIRSSVKEIDRRTSSLLYKTDHKALLDACREVMDNRSKYAKDPDVHGGDSEDDSYPNPIDPNLPPIIRQLGASYIVAEDAHVRIELGGGFHHYGVNAYLEGAEGQGDKKLLDGLWYYDDGYRERPNYWERKLEGLRPK